MTIQLERSSRRGNLHTDLHSDLAALVGRRAARYSLEAPFYTSQEVFDLALARYQEHVL